MSFISCASRKTHPDLSEDESIQPAAQVVPQAKQSTTPTKKNIETDSGSSMKTAAHSLAEQLGEAVKSQKDQDIYRYSSQILLESPNDLKALNALALYYYKKGKYAAAEYLLRKAAQQAPNSSEVHSNLGLISLALNQRREAVVEFRKALELNPEDLVAAANVGSMYIEEKDYEKALVALDSVYQKGWKDPKILANYALALTANGKFEKAEEIYKSLLKEQSSNREMLFNFAILQIEHLKKYSEGIETISRLKFIGPPSETRKRLSALEAKAKAKRSAQ